LPQNTLVAAEAQIEALATQAFAEIQGRYEQRGHDTARPILTPPEIFMPVAELSQRSAAFRRIELSHVELDPLTQTLPQQNFATKPPPHLRVDPRSEDPA